MSARIDTIGDSEAFAALDRRRIASFLLLGDYLDSEPELAKLAQDYSLLWDAANSRSVSEFVRHGSPFFWSNVGRCMAARHSLSALSRAANFALRIGFDCYFDWLPIGVAFELPAETGTDLILPSLGVKIADGNHAVNLRKEHASMVAIEFSNTSVTIDLNRVDPVMRLHREAIPGSSAVLVLAKDPSLFEANYIDTLTEDSANALHLSQMIGKSYEMIDATDPDLGHRLRSMIEWYVPMFTPGPMTHNSMTVKELFGVIFVSDAYDDIRLAEAIVHEFYHNELNLVQEVDPLHEQLAEQVFYSPWRPDARPLAGLFHALYVFSGVATFLGQAERLPELVDYVPVLRGRRAEVVAQLRLGLAQVPEAHLTDAGRDILNVIKTDIERQESELGRLHGALPEPLAKHLATWKSKHPELVARIQVPDGVSLN